MKTMILMTSLTLFIVGSCLTCELVAQNREWKAPESAAKMKNPLKSSGENVNLGKSLYVKHCKSCHGKNGEGDGTKSAELETYPGDFTSNEFQSQSDGTIFHKTSIGSGDMPAFEKKVDSKEDVWAIIVYLRTFKVD